MPVRSELDTGLWRQARGTAWRRGYRPPLSPSRFHMEPFQSGRSRAPGAECRALLRGWGCTTSPGREASFQRVLGNLAAMQRWKSKQVLHGPPRAAPTQGTLPSNLTPGPKPPEEVEKWLGLGRWRSEWSRESRPQGSPKITESAVPCAQRAHDRGPGTLSLPLPTRHAAR